MEGKPPHGRLPGGDVSGRPRAIRRRLRSKTERLQEEIERDIEMLYQKPVGDWDWEELSRGMPRGNDGKFAGSKPGWITPAIQAEAKRRMRSLTEDQLMVHANDAMKVLKDLMTDMEVDLKGQPVVPAAVKLQAAQYVLNHVVGTPKARVEIETHNPLADLMGGVLVNPDGQMSHHVVIEGSVVGEDDDDAGGGE